MPTGSMHMGDLPSPHQIHSPLNRAEENKVLFIPLPPFALWTYIISRQTYFSLKPTGVNISKHHHSILLKVYLYLHLYCCAPPRNHNVITTPFNEQVVKYSSSSSFNSIQGLPPPSYLVAHLKDLPCHHPNLLPLKPQG